MSNVQETGCSEVSTTVDRDEEAEEEEQGKTSAVAAAAAAAAAGAAAAAAAVAADDIIDVEAMDIVKKERRDPAEPQVGWCKAVVTNLF